MTTGIRISHSTGQTRSALTISNLGQQLAHVLPARDWRKIQHLFGGRFADIAHIPSREAGKIADILCKAAGDRRMPSEWADLARLFADAGHRAARSGQTWTWE
ncbi:DUF7739 domain-containing protein [Streptomyces lavendofoliae]|uniref:DUF7739 domain-containing protein n=1 Tax=Streptomyces lavendofoliae TaxID=67314 RepID=A0A918I0Z6_9ACTN|nr:hypothetical protein [Streptomyces lavendofoliae]GGU52483.1 hypothetical protein GCM10010274_46760 [Streptomyces lavendofoliae]